MNCRSTAVVVVSALLAAGAGVAGSVLLSSPTAQAQAPASAASVTPRIATVDLLGVVERLVLSDAYAPKRDALVIAKNKEIEPWHSQKKQLEDQASKLAPNAPEIGPLQEQYAAVTEKLEQMAAAANREVEAFNVSQLAAAYTAVHEAACAMADKLGYTHVIASRTGSTAMRSNTVNNAVQEMIARPVLMAPAGDDITQRLIESMGLTKVVVPEPKVGGADPAVAVPVPEGVPPAGLPSTVPTQTPAPAPVTQPK